MLTLFTKKKLTKDKVANVFVNSIIDVVDEGWADVCELINFDPSFVESPGITRDDSDKFLMIVFCANLKFLPKYFGREDESELKFKIVEKLSIAFAMDEEKLYKYVKDYDGFMTRVNHPSKNVLYSMSKTVYHKYRLNNYQEDYFKGLNAPNPLLLKRLDEVMENFIWDWDAFLDKYKVA